MLKVPEGNRLRGITSIETALILPLLLVLTFGVIEFGWLFLKANQITNAARQGARVGIRYGANTSDIETAVSNIMTTAGMKQSDSGYTVTVTDVIAGPNTPSLKVQVSVPCQNIAIVNFPLLPKLDFNLGASVTMAKEGP